jgi:hypothetical protein
MYLINKQSKPGTKRESECPITNEPKERFDISDAQTR